jgi:hypothetical protein
MDMDRETSVDINWDSTKAASDIKNLQTVFDKMQEVAEAALAEREEKDPPITPPSRKRLDSYAQAALYQRLAIIPRMNGKHYTMGQSRKLIRKYNRR